LFNNHKKKCGKDDQTVNKCTCRAIPEIGTRRWSEMFQSYIELVSWTDEYHWTYRVEGSRYVWNNKNSWFDLMVHSPRKFDAPAAPVGIILS
jgi:hypothetical protein